MPINLTLKNATVGYKLICTHGDAFGHYTIGELVTITSIVGDRCELHGDSGAVAWGLDSITGGETGIFTSIMWPRFILFDDLPEFEKFMYLITGKISMGQQ